MKSDTAHYKVISDPKELREAFLQFVLGNLTPDEEDILHERLVNEEPLQTIYNEAIQEAVVLQDLFRAVGKAIHESDKTGVASTFLSNRSQTSSTSQRSKKHAWSRLLVTTAALVAICCVIPASLHLLSTNMLRGLFKRNTGTSNPDIEGIISYAPTQCSSPRDGEFESACQVDVGSHFPEIWSALQDGTDEFSNQPVIIQYISWVYDSNSNTRKPVYESCELTVDELSNDNALRLVASTVEKTKDYVKQLPNAVLLDRIDRTDSRLKWLIINPQKYTLQENAVALQNEENKQSVIYAKLLLERAQLLKNTGSHKDAEKCRSAALVYLTAIITNAQQFAGDLSGVGDDVDLMELSNKLVLAEPIACEPVNIDEFPDFIPDATYWENILNEPARAAMADALWLMSQAVSSDKQLQSQTQLAKEIDSAIIKLAPIGAIAIPSIRPTQWYGF